MQIKPMSPVRACQVASQLLRRISASEQPPQPNAPLIITQEERDAIEVLRAVTTKVACGFTVPGQRKDGTFHIPKK